MKISGFFLLILAAQAFCIALLSHKNFHLDTYKMLEVFVSSVWGSVFSLGACIIYLLRRSKVLKIESKDADLNTNKKVVLVAFWMLACSFLFILLSAIFPAKNFIKDLLALSESRWVVISSFYHSLLITFFVWPCLVALVVGGWILISEYES